MRSIWKTSTLGETCEMYQPKTISGKEMVEGGKYPVYGANGVIGRYDKFNHEKPQLLITCRGATCGSVNVSEPYSWITCNAMVVRPKDEGAIDLRFLEYLFRGGIDISKAITGAAQPQITRTNLAPLEITYPTSIEEQQRIVAILDEAFAGIATATANAEKNLQNARELFDSTLQSALADKGDRWPETSLGEQVDLLTGFAFKSDGYTENDDGISLLRGDNIVQGEFRWADVKKWPKEDIDSYEKYFLQVNDVVLAMDRTWVKAGLKYAQVSELDLPCLLLQRVARLRAKKTIDSQFLKYLIGSRFFTQYVLSIQTGIGVPHISGKQITDFQFFLPSIEEQKSIASKLHEIERNSIKMSGIYQQKKNKLDELKQAILQKAFAGQLH